MREESEKRERERGGGKYRGEGKREVTYDKGKESAKEGGEKEHK